MAGRSGCGFPGLAGFLQRVRDCLRSGAGHGRILGQGTGDQAVPGRGAQISLPGSRALAGLYGSAGCLPHRAPTAQPGSIRPDRRRPGPGIFHTAIRKDRKSPLKGDYRQPQGDLLPVRRCRIHALAGSPRAQLVAGPHGTDPQPPAIRCGRKDSDP